MIELNEQESDRFWLKVDKCDDDDCWVWNGCTNGRYDFFYLKGKMLKAHRVSYTITHGDVGEGKVICHSCDNPVCVNPSHLWAGTQKENLYDAMKKGKSIHRLDKHQVEAIAASNKSARDLAEEFGVHVSSIKGWRQRLKLLDSLQEGLGE